MKIINLFPLSIIQEKILLEENTKTEMHNEIQFMVSNSKNKEYKFMYNLVYYFYIYLS